MEIAVDKESTESDWTIKEAAYRAYQMCCKENRLIAGSKDSFGKRLVADHRYSAYDGGEGIAAVPRKVEVSCVRLSDVRDEEGMNLSGDSEWSFVDDDKDNVAVDDEVLHPIFGSLFGKVCDDSWDGIPIPS